MKFPIGFQSGNTPPELDAPAATPEIAAKKSVVLVDFSDCRIPLALQYKVHQ